MFSTLRQIFSQIRYTTITIFTSVVVFTFVVWLPNLTLIKEILFNSSASVVEKISFLFSLFGSIQTNFSSISASYTVAIAMLFGINTALFIYFIRIRRTKMGNSEAALSIGGLVSGVFGIGCAACGTFILSSLLGIFGAAGILVFLPFGGEEFGVLGVILLLYSSYILLKKIAEPLVCEQ